MFLLNDYQITPAGRARLALALGKECAGYQCPGGDFVLTKRCGVSGFTLHLQCSGCGRSVGGALSRVDHPDWQSYPEWDETLREKQRAHVQEKNDARQTEVQSIREELNRRYENRRAEYAEWCRTSAEWKRARDRVFQKANGWCEACLSERASVVHHLTYRLGKLPPAWELRAVCHSCHERLHSPYDEWCEPGMARGENSADK